MGIHGGLPQPARRQAAAARATGQIAELPSPTAPRAHRTAMHETTGWESGGSPGAQTELPAE